MNKSTKGFTKAFTGIFYMYDYTLFWDQFDKHVNDSKEIVDVFKNIELFNFIPKEIKLTDTGTADLYYQLIELVEDKYIHLHKTKLEHKYRLNDLFIKSGSVEKIENLFKRGQHLMDYIPELRYKGSYFFSYQYVKGDTLYKINNKEVYITFLNWFEKEFCTHLEQSLTFKEDAFRFYNTKTFLRFDQIKSNNCFKTLDEKETINGQNVLRIDEYLTKIDWDSLCNIIPTKKFHGDLQFDNIIYNGNDFKLIDWREDFGGNVEYGDLYYDFAKLYGGMILNYFKLKNIDNFSYVISGNSVILTNYHDIILQSIMDNEFLLLLDRNHIDINRIKLLTAIIFLNMSPLHIKGFDKFLFLKSKLLFAEIFH